MAISSGSFIIALNYAGVANVLFMQALAPVLAAAMGMALGERVAPRTWTAMLIAIGGVALMAGGPGHPGALGLCLSLLMTTAFAATLVITRHRRDVSMAPATCLSQLLVLAVERCEQLAALRVDQRQTVLGLYALRQRGE